MAKGINLLTGVQKQASERYGRFIRLARTGSLVLLIFYCLVVILVYYFWFSTQHLAKTTEEEIAIKKQKISNLEKVETLQTLLKDRLSSLRFLMNQKRPDCQAILNYFIHFPRDEIQFTQLSLESNGSIAVSGLADSSHSATSFIDSVSDQSGKLFKQAVLTSLTRKKGGEYLFSLSLQTLAEQESQKAEDIKDQKSDLEEPAS